MLLCLIFAWYATRIDLGLLLIIIWPVGPYGLLVVLDQPPWEHTPKNEGIYSFLRTNQFANAVNIALP
jgi:hypothetical protein